MKYRKKPVEVEVRHFSSDRTFDEIIEIKDWCNARLIFNAEPQLKGEPTLDIVTENGFGRIGFGCYIVKDDEGKFHVYTADKFNKLFERVD